MSTVDNSPAVEGFDDDGVAPTARPVLTGGSTGTVVKTIHVDASGNQVAVGAGTAGTPAGGVVSVQGVPSGIVVPVADGGGSLTVDTPQLPAVLVGGRLDENIGAWLGATTPTVGQKTMAASLPVAIASDQTAVPVSGTVTANIGTSGSLALDATLTGGTQKAIVRGGTKGATAAADITSTAEGADHQALDVQIMSGGVAKDPTAIRPLTSGDVVTANQGSPSSGGNRWPVAVTDTADAIVRPGDATNSAVRVNIVAGSTNATQVDKSAFNEGVSVFTPVGGVVNETIAADPTEDQAAAARITPKRAIHVNLRNLAGTETGTAATPLRFDPTGTTAQPISGTVTSNIGTSGALALDATLTGGTQKAIVRGGVKGATVAADVTSTAEGTDHQALDVQIMSGGVAKDPTAIRALTAGDIVTAAQGTAAAGTGRWPVAVTDTSDVVVRPGDAVNNAVRVNVVSGSGSQVDKSSFVEGTTVFTPVGGVFNETISSDPTEDQAAAARITAKRALHSNLRTSTGVQLLGQQTSAVSLPVVLASDQSAFPRTADGTGTGIITALAGTVTAVTTGCSAVTFNVTGTWTATLLIEGTNDNIQWTPLSAVLPALPGVFSNFTFPGVFIVNCSGFQLVQIRATAYTTGTISVSWEASSAATGYLNQGAPMSAAYAWPIKLTDGTDVAAVDSVGRLEVNLGSVNNFEPQSTGTIIALNSSIGAPVQGMSTMTFKVTGTWVATLTVEASINGGVSYDIVRGYRQSDGAIIQTFSANDVVTVPCGSFSHIQVRASSFTSGTVNVAFRGGMGNNVITAMLANEGQQTMAASTAVVIASDQSPIATTSTQLPAALVGGRLDGNVGAWLGATTPTVGQKTAAASLPVIIASDQTPLVDTAIAGTITALAGTVGTASDLNDAGVVVIQVTGVFVGTIQAEGSLDGTTFEQIFTRRLSGSTSQPTITAPLIARANAAGCRRFQVRATAWTSGTATVTLRIQNMTSATTLVDGLAVTGNAVIGNVGIKDNNNGPVTVKAASTPAAIADLPLVVSIHPSRRPSYLAQITGLVTPAVATDIFTITGSATKIVQILEISINGTQTLGATFDLLLVARSTANTAGTSTSRVAVPLNSTSAAATATILAYTANPTLGTAIGTMQSEKLALTAAGNSIPIKWRWDPNIEEGPTLNGIAQVLAINLNGVSVGAGESFDIFIRWMEY